MQQLKYLIDSETNHNFICVFLLLSALFERPQVLLGTNILHVKAVCVYLDITRISLSSYYRQTYLLF